MAKATKVVGLHGSDLTKSQLIGIYRNMVTTRLISQRAWILNRQGKVYFHMPSDGSEAADAGSAVVLRPGQDILMPYVRDLAAALTFGMTIREVMLNLLLKSDDPNGGGRNMPLHFGSRRLRIISHSSPTGTQIPQAVGIAMASKLAKRDEVTIVYFGDGASNKGDFHEGLNLAGLMKAPVVFFCVNNGVALSIPNELQIAGDSIAMRAESYGFQGVQVDGTDPLAVYEVTTAAVARARRGDGPTLIEALTVRLMSHSSSDDHTRYRTTEELEIDKLRDPVILFQNRLLQEGILDKDEDGEIWASIQKEINEATDWAESQPDPVAETALLNVYHESTGVADNPLGN